MTRSQRKTLLFIALSAVTLVFAIVADQCNWFSENIRTWAVPVGYALPFLIVGAEILWDAVRNIFHGDFFDEAFLMALASVVAFALGEYAEAVIVMLFYQIGEFFQSLAVAKSRRSIAQLMNIRPERANVEKNGTLRTVEPESVAVGDVIVIKPGERIPLDGIVTEGQAYLDTAALTGESVPRSVSVGDTALSGCIVQSSILKLRVTKPFTESTVMRILALVEDAAEKKSRTERFITSFARWYTPSVVLAAVLLAIFPPLVFAAEWNIWILRALTFLVISCPCALVISVPLTFFGGIGGASARGILIKGSNYLDVLSKVDTVVLDKTGTLTHGNFTVTEIVPNAISKEELLTLAAAAEAYSDHPIARSIREAASSLPLTKPADISEVREIPGRGVQICIDGTRIDVGNAAWMEELQITVPQITTIGTVVHVARNGAYLGYLQISDTLKPQAQACISALKKIGIHKTVMLTGDSRAVAEEIGRTIGIDCISADCLPDQKVGELERLLAEKPSKTKLAFAGDGINDAPALALADIGIAMGALGSDAAIEAADVVLTDDNPLKIATAIRIARRTMQIAKQNIIFSLGVKFAIMLLGAAGLAGMWLAVFADVGVCLIAVLNALRTLRTNTL